MSLKQHACSVQRREQQDTWGGPRMEAWLRQAGHCVKKVPGPDYKWEFSVWMFPGVNRTLDVWTKGFSLLFIPDKVVLNVEGSLLPLKFSAQQSYNCSLKWYGTKTYLTTWSLMQALIAVCELNMGCHILLLPSIHWKVKIFFWKKMSPFLFMDNKWVRISNAH